MSERKEKNPFGALPDVGNIDLDKIGSVYGYMPKNSSGPEYIQSNPRGRDLIGRLSFNTGVLWLGGFSSGGAYGFVEGWRNATSPNYKIRFNSVMNGVSKRGTLLGNNLGIIGFLHTSCVYISDSLELDRLAGSAIVTPIFSGAVTGSLYMASRGPRAAALAGGIGAALSTAYSIGGGWVYNVMLGKSGRY
jgi:hypothetical protein